MKTFFYYYIFFILLFNLGCYINLNPFQQDESKNSVSTESTVQILYVDQKVDVTIHYDDYSLKLLSAEFYELTYSEKIPLYPIPIEKPLIHKNIRFRFLNSLGEILGEKFYYAEPGDYSYTFTLPEGFNILEIFDDNTGIFMQYTRQEMETMYGLH